MSVDVWKRYWKYYGGIKALLSSGYLWGAFAISAIFYPAWSSVEWWVDVLQIAPSLLGFSLGGYAMWIAFGDNAFRRIMSGDFGAQLSPFMEVSAAFVHFMIVQLLAVFTALFAKAFYFPLSSESWLSQVFGKSFPILCQIGSYLGYTIFVYSLLTALAAIMALFRAAHWYDQYHERLKQQKSINNGDE